MNCKTLYARTLIATISLPLFLACCRQGVFFIPLILILPRTLGLVGLETCQPIADVFTFIVSLPFLLAFLNQLSRMDDAEKAKAAS